MSNDPHMNMCPCGEWYDTRDTARVYGRCGPLPELCPDCYLEMEREPDIDGPDATDADYWRAGER